MAFGASDKCDDDKSVWRRDTMFIGIQRIFLFPIYQREMSICYRKKIHRPHLIYLVEVFLFVRLHGNLCILWHGD